MGNLTYLYREAKDSPEGYESRLFDSDNLPKRGWSDTPPESRKEHRAEAASSRTVTADEPSGPTDEQIAQWGATINHANDDHWTKAGEPAMGLNALGAEPSTPDGQMSAEGLGNGRGSERGGPGTPFQTPMPLQVAQGAPAAPITPPTTAVPGRPYTPAIPLSWDGNRLRIPGVS